MKKKRMFFSITVLFMLVFPTMAFAGYQADNFADGLGYAELQSDYSNGMRDVAAQASISVSYYSTLSVTKTYQDGSEYDYWSGFNRGTSTYSYGYEWTEDYQSCNGGHLGINNPAYGGPLYLSVN